MPNDRPQATSRVDGVGVDACTDDLARGSVRGPWLSVGTGQDMDTSWAGWSPLTSSAKGGGQPCWDWPLVQPRRCEDDGWWAGSFRSTSDY